jgi:hypothetical protein
MRRQLALLVAAASLRAAPALAEPLDISLERLGAPNAADPQLAAEARRRFALLSSEVGLALSSMLLTPAETVGHSGFEFGLDFGFAPVHPKDYTSAATSPFRGQAPGGLRLPSLHVRKALPFSFEIGGRAIYFDQSTMVATQLELKWALNEGIGDLPDVALRGALTHLFGQRDWDLSTAELDLMVGKRFGIGGVLSLAPYGALRFTWLDASSGFIHFGNPAPLTPPDPSAQLAAVAAFPRLQRHDHRFTRYTLGVRMVAATVTISAEATYFGGKTFSGQAPGQLGLAGYPTFEVPSSVSGAVNLGFSF